jgi:CRP-like cAMP-binding protein
VNKLKYLSRVDLFRVLGREELEDVSEEVPITPITKGTLLTSPHHSQGFVFLIKSGSVRLYTLTSEGKEFTLDVLTTGHMFGDMGFSTDQPNTYAITLEDSIICKMSREQLKQLLSENPELGIKYIEILSARLNEVEELLEHMAYSSLRKRLLFLLQKLLEKFGADSHQSVEWRGEPGWYRLEVELTHQELASMTGSIRETVTEMISRFSAEGIVAKTGHRKPIWIHKDRLRNALLGESSSGRDIN